MYNRHKPGSRIEGETEAASIEVAMKRGNAIGVKGPCCTINMGGRGEMTKTPVSLQDLRRRLYVKAKAESSWRFWGLYVHVCKRETLREAYQLTKANDGAPGIDGVTFEAIEAEGVEGFLEQLRQELIERRYRPERLRKVEIPKEDGRIHLSIPTVASYYLIVQY